MATASSCDHTAIDEAILGRIAKGDAPTFSTILAAVREARHGVCPERLCDRRIQALRRAGKIVLTAKPRGWAIAVVPKSKP